MLVGLGLITHIKQLFFESTALVSAVDFFSIDILLQILTNQLNYDQKIINTSFFILFYNNIFAKGKKNNNRNKLWAKW